MSYTATNNSSQAFVHAFLIRIKSFEMEHFATHRHDPAGSNENDRTLREISELRRNSFSGKRDEKKRKRLTGARGPWWTGGRLGIRLSVRRPRRPRRWRRKSHRHRPRSLLRQNKQRCAQLGDGRPRDESASREVRSDEKSNQSETHCTNPKRKNKRTKCSLVPRAQGHFFIKHR